MMPPLRGGRQFQQLRVVATGHIRTEKRRQWFGSSMPTTTRRLRTCLARSVRFAQCYPARRSEHYRSISRARVCEPVEYAGIRNSELAIPRHGHETFQVVRPGEPSAGVTQWCRLESQLRAWIVPVALEQRRFECRGRCCADPRSGQPAKFDGGMTVLPALTARFAGGPVPARRTERGARERGWTPLDDRGILSGRCAGRFFVRH
jgi:hypothetical protein